MYVVKASNTIQRRAAKPFDNKHDKFPDFVQGSREVKGKQTSRRGNQTR
jgi:hypothetical protein